MRSCRTTTKMIGRRIFATLSGLTPKLRRSQKVPLRFIVKKMTKATVFGDTETGVLVGSDYVM